MQTIKTAVDAVIGDPSIYVKRIQVITAKENMVPDRKRKGELFWNTNCPLDIFKAHPDSARSFLCNPDDEI